MNINTEAAELLHAVADLYECGALKLPTRTKIHRTMDYVDPRHAIWMTTHAHGLPMEGPAMLRAFEMLADQCGTFFITWYCAKWRTTDEVISLLRRAAQRVEEAC